MVLPVDPQRYLVFLGVMSVLAFTPGPANLFAVANGMQRGRMSAVVAAAGMNTATLAWFAAAALGLGTLVAAFPGFFSLFALAGGLYVAWLGVQSIRAGLRDADGPSQAAVRGGRSAFRDGFAVQIANPKVVLFFTAVLPPFVAPERPVPPQMVLFAVATLGMDMLAMTAYGLGGAAFARRMLEPKFRRAFNFSAGALLLAAAALILAQP